MQWRHGAWLDAALESVSHDQFISFPEPRQKAGNVSKIVAAVGISHYHVLAASRGNSAHKRAAVSFLIDMHYPSSETIGDFLGPVSAAIVGNDDFPANPVLSQRVLCLLDACG
jgi:hypothetical protein